MDYLDPDDFEGLRAPSEQWNASIPPQPSVTERYLTEPLEDIPVADLIDLYEGIKSALPAHKLQDIDLAQELVLQFMRVKELQSDTLSSSRSKGSDKTSAANAVATMLAHLTRLQTELHTAERFKLMEVHLIKALKDFPELSESFLKEYERALGGI